MHPLVVDLVHAIGRAFYRDEYAAVLDALCERPMRDDGLHVDFGLHEKQVRKILLDLARERLVCEQTVRQRRGKIKVRGELDIDALRRQIERGDEDSKNKKRKRKDAFGDTDSDSDSSSDSDDSSSDEDPTKKMQGKSKGVAGALVGVGGKAAERKRNAAVRNAARVKAANEADAMAEDGDEEEEGGGPEGAAGSNSAASAALPAAPRIIKKVKVRVWYINPRFFVDVVKYRMHLLRVSPSS
jgi:TFIIE alpha subunit